MTFAFTDPASEPQPAQQVIGEAVPYAPSFIDRFIAFVHRLPLPYWVTYLLLFILECAVLLVVSWIDGWLPAFQFDAIVLAFPIWIWGPLAIVAYLDSLSLRALSEFGPLLSVPSETRRRLEYGFTTMPARSVQLSGIAWTGVYLFFWFVAFADGVANYGAGPLATLVWFVAGLVSFFVGSVIYYHSVRQLRLVSRTVRMVSQFNLFRLDPVYSFSVLTSRTGICWVALITLTLLSIPLELGRVPLLSLLISQIVLASGAFLLPLRVVNRRLVAEKRRLVAELDQRTESTLTRLHQQIDENALQEVSRLNDALKGLTTEREILAKIPTWPWRPGLFAGFLSVIVFPVVLFLIQFGLSEWLGR